jgi:hypothetical protein
MRDPVTRKFKEVSLSIATLFNSKSSIILTWIMVVINEGAKGMARYWRAS